MGRDRNIYLGPYVLATERKTILTYENLVCSNNKCKANKKPDRWTKVTLKFCPECGSKMENKTLKEDYYPSLFELLEDIGIKQSDRLSEITNDECSALKNRTIALIPNIKVNYTSHFTDDEGIVINFDPTAHIPDDVIASFKIDFNKELAVLEKNYDNIRYRYGMIIWFS